MPPGWLMQWALGKKGSARSSVRLGRFKKFNGNKCIGALQGIVLALTLAAGILFLFFGVPGWQYGLTNLPPAGETVPVAATKVPCLEIDMVVTAYCKCQRCCGRYADGITASGFKLVPGCRVVAAPDWLPFGTVVHVPGYGPAAVLDRGGRITDNKLDVYFDNHADAVRWGKRKLAIAICGVQK